MRRGDNPFVDSDLRCGCGKRRAVDVGPGIFGQPEFVEFCPNCETPPQARAWETELRAAIAIIVHKGEPS